MNCIICNSNSNYYFSKTYSERPFDEFMREIGKVDYYRCKHCGFVLSKTHSELDEDRWNKLNYAFHHHLENQDRNGLNQPPYVEQAIMLTLLGRNAIIHTDDMIDYASGYGRLSNLLGRYFDFELPIFDPYIQANDLNRFIIRKSELKTYKTVINSAMFEHILRREDLNIVNSLVDSEGCLIIHTVVCENIPNDPNWFYLRSPVHTAFHTNRSMEILMGEWGYCASVYCPKSKCWILFKNANGIENKIAVLNCELQSDWFYFKKRFVDYWKGF